MPSQLDKLAEKQKLKLLNKLYDLGAQTLWRPRDIVDWFVEIGVDCRLDEDCNTVVFLGERVESMVGEWGDPGIYAPRLLSVVTKKVGTELNYYGLNGRGFVYRDHLRQLAEFWGFGDCYEH